MLDVWLWKPWNPEPRNLKMRFSPFPFSHFGNFCMSRFGHRNSRSFESRNPEVRDPPSFFSQFRGLYMWLFGYLHSRNPQLWISEVLITFRIFEICCVLMINFCVHKNPNPETSKYSVSCHNFGKCCVLMSGSCTHEAPNPETLKWCPTVILYFIFRQTAGSSILFSTCDHRNPISLCIFTKL